MYRCILLLLIFRSFVFSVEIIDLTPANMPINVTNAVAWHPEEDVVVIGNVRHSSAVYRIDHEARTITEIAVLTDRNVFSLAWHPSGKYLAVGTSNANKIYSYDKNQDRFTLLKINGNFNDPNVTHGITWSQDGEMLLTANERIDFLINLKKPNNNLFNRIYSFKNENLGEIEFINPIDQHSRSVELSPCGHFLVVANATPLNANEDYLRTSNVYQIDWENKEYIQITSEGMGVACAHKATFSPCGHFIAVAGDGYDKGESNKLFYFDNRLIDITPQDPEHPFVKNNISHAIAWSPSGNYVFVGNAFGELNQLFAFDKETFSLTDISGCFSAFHIDNGTHGFSFSPCGNYIFLANDKFQKPKKKIVSEDPYTFISNFKHREKFGEQNQLLMFLE